MQAVLDKLTSIDTIDLKLLYENEITESTYELDTSNYYMKPYAYQLEGIQYGLNHKSWLLLDEAGLGKTYQIIHIAEELYKQGKIKHCLIICGINNLKYNWKKEIKKHSNLSATILGERINRKGKSVIGSVEARCEHILSDIEEFFVITNIETLRKDEVISAFKKSRTSFDMIVVDEIHACKSVNTDQGNNLLKLEADYKVGLTGTLLTNNPADAYVPLKWIGVERSPFSTFKYYYSRYAGPFNNTLIGYRNLDILKDQLNKFSIRRKKSDELNLPPKVIISEYIEMNEDQLKFYSDLEAGICDSVDKVEITNTALLAMVSRLRQATATPSTLTTLPIVSAKLKRACELAREIVESGHKVVIFSVFKDAIYELENMLKDLKPTVNTGDIDDATISHNIDNFQNNPDHKIFLATSQKCGTGITLNSASYMIFIDTPWTYAVTSQAEDRIHRIGTKDTVFIYRLIVKDTIDERVDEIVNDKKAVSEYVIDDEISEENIDILRKYIQDLAIKNNNN